MCHYEFYLSTACGHHFPKLPPRARPNLFFNNYHPTIAVPESLTCAAVKLALKFYHDQVVYLPADMNCGTKVDIPKSCPIVHRPRDGPTKRTIREQEKAIRMLTDTMLENGLGRWQEWQVKINAAVLDQCSNRAKPGEHSRTALRRHQELQYPRNMYAHVQNVKAFQARDKRFMMPNVTYINVDFGCGGPFSAECLTGWDRVSLVTHRLHLWGDATTHPKPCSHECLVGWSGADLDTYRQQTWAGDNPKNWGHLDYAEFARDHTFKHTLPSERWGVVDYTYVSHLHADQFGWNGKEFVRKHHLPSGQVVHVPEMVSIPVPERLDQVLREMSRAARPGSPLPKEADQASIEDILGRLPEAFNEQDPLTGEGSEPLMGAAEGSESGTTAVGEPEEEEKPIPGDETPEMAEARGQRARKEMREKIARDFSEGKETTVVEERTDSQRAQSTGNTPAEADNDTALTKSSKVKRTGAKDLPTPATTQTAGPSILPLTLSTAQPQAPLTLLDQQLRGFQTRENQRLRLPSPNLDESNSSPTDEIGDDLYDTEEEEHDRSGV